MMEEWNFRIKIAVATNDTMVIFRYLLPLAPVRL